MTRKPKLLKPPEFPDLIRPKQRKRAHGEAQKQHWTQRQIEHAQELVRALNQNADQPAVCHVFASVQFCEGLTLEPMLAENYLEKCECAGCEAYRLFIKISGRYGLATATRIFNAIAPVNQQRASVTAARQRSHWQDQLLFSLFITFRAYFLRRGHWGSVRHFAREIAKFNENLPKELRLARSSTDAETIRKQVEQMMKKAGLKPSQ